MKKLMPKLKGFTIIEVIIVLVIGAVIMLAVFLVIPQLQVNARNNQRRNDIQRVLVAARQYYTTNTFDTADPTAGTKIKNIISSTFQDPSLSAQGDGNRNYSIIIRTSRYSVVTRIEIFNNKKCKSNQSTASGDGNLEASDGSLAVTLDVEPLKPTPEVYNGVAFYYGKSHYCVSD